MNKFKVSKHADNGGIVVRHPNGSILCELQTTDCVYCDRPDLAKKTARQIADLFNEDKEIPLG